jgi:hypothetical protein
MNSVWRIAFGDYDLAVDRRGLTYSLTETKTGTVWADGLPVGWVELEERESGTRTRYDFGQAKVVSVSEKSGPQGKRLLLGLDLLGIPIDLYFICSQREVQLTVEATRDTRTHLVQDVGLFPGLVSVRDDGASYLVIPHGEGAMLHAADAPKEPTLLRIWDAVDGVTMPFVGAVRCANGDVRQAQSALALITDSAYGRFMLRRVDDGGVALDTEYERDPERRRLDVRLIVLPETNHVAVARAYRDKIIGERNHVTLRRKMRERSSLGDMIGSAFVFGEPEEMPSVPEHAVFITGDRTGPELYANLARTPLADVEEDGGNRWDNLEGRMNTLRGAATSHPLVGSEGSCDWSSVECDYWCGVLGVFDEQPRTAFLPLYEVVYRDSVVAPGQIEWEMDFARLRLLRTILALSPPWYVPPFINATLVERTYAVLGYLHRLTFPAFLTVHRFLTPDLKVEEGVYSDKTRVVINQSETEAWEGDDLHLPPLGFYVRHAQMEAHDALRVRERTFETRVWRIVRSQDGQPLETSGDVLRQEFPV